MGKGEEGQEECHQEEQGEEGSLGGSNQSRRSGKQIFQSKGDEEGRGGAEARQEDGDDQGQEGQVAQLFHRLLLQFARRSKNWSEGKSSCEEEEESLGKYQCCQLEIV